MRRPLFVLGLAFALSHSTASVADDASASDWSSARPLINLQDTKRGEELYRIGQCGKCHQDDARGGPRGPDLRDEQWEHCDGSVDGIRGVLERGVSREELKDKSRRFGMNPATNAIPDAADIAILAAYIKSLASAGAADPKPAERTDPPSEGSGIELADAVSDDEAKFKIRPPASWTEAPAASIAVPGKVRKAWTPDSQTSIVVFQQTPATPMTPRVLLDTSVAALKASGHEVRKEGIGKLGPHRAMRIIVVGDGTGGALTGSGAVRTLQQWVAVPRKDDILVLLLTCPEADFGTHEKLFARIAKTIEIGGEQTSEQRTSK